jgi:hypothetical protein
MTTAAAVQESTPTADVGCVACEESASGEAVTLMGLVYCADCGADEAFRLRATGDEWSALTLHDQVEVLEVIETQARVERAQLTGKAVSP